MVALIVTSRQGDVREIVGQPSLTVMENIREALTDSNSDADCNACLRVTDAKWWIDCRDLSDVDLMAAANPASNLQCVPTLMPSSTNPTIAR